MKIEKFEEEYKKLNLNQKKTVDAIEGTVMVMAGPGTGKTQILSLRIANILLKTDTNPENILALTFTNSGVYSMKKRLTSLIGSSTAHRVNIETFHSFCEGIIKKYSDYFKEIGNSKLATEIKRIKIIEEILDKGNLKILRPWGDARRNVKFILSAIDELKKNGIDPEDFAKKINEQKKEILDDEKSYYKRKTQNAEKGDLKVDVLKPIEKNNELFEAYGEYQDKLRKNHFYDYNDMILETLKMIKKNKGLLAGLQENFQYVLVDEHQDTNDAQNQILSLLVGYSVRPNLFIVGDDKQAIYRFQGASIENFLYFGDKFKDVQRIDLEDNYRSTQKILDGSQSLIENNLQKIDATKKLQAKIGGNGEKIIVRSFPSLEVELQETVKEIKNKIEVEGVSPDEIAVVYRKNVEVFEIASLLEKFNVPFVIESKQDVFSDSDIRKIIILFRTINNFGEDEFLAQALHIDFLGINPLDVYKLISYCARKRISLYDGIKSEKILKEAKIKAVEGFVSLISNLESWKKYVENENAVSSFEKIIRESGFLKKILSAEDSIQKIDKLNKIFDEIKKMINENPYSKLSDFISFLDIINSHNLSIETKVGGLVSGVRLMTAHKTKGLEFDLVYIIGVFDKKWGNSKRPEQFKLPVKNAQGDNDDERRLFYVALTRAKKRVFISYHRQNLDGKNLLPSQFIDEIDKEFLEFEEFNLNENTEDTFRERKKQGASIKDKEYLNNLFLDRGLTATAINNYLKCPWQYFYNNLIRLPGSFSKTMEYGNIIHATLEKFFEKIKNEEEIDKSVLLSIFESFLERSLLVGGDFEESKEKGLKSLSGYYDEYNKTFNKNILNEFAVKGISLEVDDEREVFLNGKLDKIEVLDDKGNVNVVDYKTGKVKSKGEIEGTTKTSDGNYKRQLVFYKMLLNRFDKGRYKMLSGEIDFTEPSNSGKYKKEKFVITDDEVKELEEKVKEISKQILNLDFWDKKCDNKECQYCKLREML